MLCPKELGGAATPQGGGKIGVTAPPVLAKHCWQFAGGMRGHRPDSARHGGERGNTCRAAVNSK
jgi:hypothetical protein